MGCIPRKRESVAQGPCPFGPSLPARFGWSVLTTVLEHIRVPTQSDVAHRSLPSGSASSCFAPLASPRLLGVRQQPEGGAVTSAPLGWAWDRGPHPHAHQVIKGRVCLCLSSPWLTPSFERTGRSPLRTGRETCRLIRLSGFLVSSSLACCGVHPRDIVCRAVCSCVFVIS